MTTKINLLAVSLFLPVFISAQNVIPEPAQYRPAKGEFVLSIAENKALETNNVLPSRVVQRIAPDCTTGADEAYRLEITPDSVFIQSATVTGAFRGEETLKQLLRSGKGTTSACVINDAPRYSWRGFMLDESRHFFGKEKVKQLLDIMASLRLNVFHWHLTDEPGWRIEIKKYPLLTKVGSKGNYHDPSAPATFYTQEDIKDIVAYAAARHIMIVPEFDMPGHATAACRAYPELSGGGEGRWKDFTFHPCKEETFRFISDVLDELITLFPSPYIHIYIQRSSVTDSRPFRVVPPTCASAALPSPRTAMRSPCCNCRSPLRHTRSLTATLPAAISCPAGPRASEKADPTRQSSRSEGTVSLISRFSTAGRCTSASGITDRCSFVRPALSHCSSR